MVRLRYKEVEDRSRVNTIIREACLERCERLRFCFIANMDLIKKILKNIVNQRVWYS